MILKSLPGILAGITLLGLAAKGVIDLNTSMNLTEETNGLVKTLVKDLRSVKADTDYLMDNSPRVIYDAGGAVVIRLPEAHNNKLVTLTYKE